jgi:HAE1 family hydrophobic/amphiphilic exporter-1
MISSFFVRRPIVAIVIAILTVIIGSVSMLGLPIAQFPNVLPPQVTVQTTYTGADAQTIEQSTATPIEQQMNGVDRMLYVRSTSANDGTMSQNVTFDIGTDPDVDTVLANNRFSQAQPSLPQDVKNFGVTVKKSLAFPMMVISLYSPDRRYDPAFLSNYALINIDDALLRVHGVGDVRNFGSSDYSMRIWLKPDLIASLGLTVTDVQNALRAQNVVNPAGKIGAEPAPAGQEVTWTVRAQGRLVNAEEFANVIVREKPDGTVVRLKDIGRVELGSLDYQQYGTFNGKPSSIIAVFQTPGTNALEVAKGVRMAMTDLAKRFPAGVAYDVSLDTTAPVYAGIREIVVTLLEAMALVAIVVFVFLQSWRATLIPMLTVPVSLVGAFIIFPPLGFSINTLSLFGMVLAIGLVVDDAIVVVEAVEQQIERGLSARDATLQAMKEVQGPVIAIALILAAVFVPVAFVPGITGRLYQQFALTIAVSVLISAFNALTLSPALCSLLLRPRSAQRSTLGKLGELFNRAFGRATDGYVSVAGSFARKLVVPVVLLLGVSAVAWGLGRRLPTGFLPDEDMGYAIVDVHLPDGASLQRTRAAFDDVDRVLASEKGIARYNDVAGYGLLTNTSATYSGFSFISFKPWEERKGAQQAASAIVARLNAAFSRIPEARVLAITPPAIPGLSASGGFSLMVQDRSGGSYEFLAQNAMKFIAAARNRPEFAYVIPNFSAAVPQLYADVDKEKALAEGVSLSDAYATLQTFLGGSYVNDFSRFGRQWRVFMQADAPYRTRPEDIGQFYVRNNRGEMLPLSSFVTVRQITGPEYTVRFNLYRSVEIIGAPATGYSSGQALAALEDVAAKTLPPEIGYAWNGMSYQEKAASGGSGRVLALSLVFVFLILAALYESWSLPFSVLLSTPFAVFGAYAGLLARRFDNNVYAQIGLVMLIGLTAKNAILIVEFARDELTKGKGILEAALEGARLRLRPILMTSFAFILGCAPLWIAAGAGASGRRMLGTVVIAGMLVATLLGVFVVPALFVLIQRLSRRKEASTEVESLPPPGSDTATAAAE